MLMASAISPNSPFLRPNTDNNCVGITILNPDVFTNVGFDSTTYTTKKYLYYYSKDKNMHLINQLGYNQQSYFWPAYLQGLTTTYTNKNNQKYETPTKSRLTI